jgi:hypothetical protein
MNSSAKKKEMSESDKSYRDNSKNSEILFGLDLSKENEENISPLREKLELSESRSIPQNSNLNLNFMNKVTFMEKYFIFILVIF